MPKKPDPYLVDDEATAEDFARMRPASEALAPELYASLVAGYEARQAVKRQASAAKEPDMDRNRQI